jgi:NAD-dependent DNA ligase
MLSERVRLILIARDAPFTEEEMKSITDKQGWAWIFANSPPKQPHKTEICFTGFGNSHKAELQEIAKDRGFKCVTCVTKALSFLCVGPNPGPSKTKEAAEKGVPIISEEDFLEGRLP